MNWAPIQQIVTRKERPRAPSVAPDIYASSYVWLWGSDCDTINAFLMTDGTVQFVTPAALMPYATCPDLQTPIIHVWSVANYDWSLGCTGQNGNADGTCIIDSDWDLDIMTRVYYPDGTKCLWRIGLNQHPDADVKFTQHDLGRCGIGDYTMTLNRPWTWLYGATSYCYRYQFQ